MIDESFIKRTYRTTVIVWAFVVFTLFALKLWFAAAGFSIGTLVSIGSLASISKVVNETFVPNAERPHKVFAKIELIKFVMLLAIIAGVVLTRKTELILGFCGGIGLAQFVMLLKSAGNSINRFMNK